MSNSRIFVDEVRTDDRERRFGERDRIDKEWGSDHPEFRLEALTRHFFFLDLSTLGNHLHAAWTRARCSTLLVWLLM